MLRELFVLSALAAITCGLRLESRIMGGEDASATKFPYQVSVRAKSGYAFNHICGGSIFTERVIITAAHCLTGRSPTDVRIVAGVSSLNAIAGLLEIDMLILNSKYNAVTIDHDVGLIILARPLVYGDTVQPIALAERNPAAGVDAIVTGWGATEQDGAANEVLQETTLQIVDNAVCAGSYGPGAITDNMICAGVEEGGRNACKGDSGGPLAVEGQLVGIVSWGRGCGGPGYPGVYAAVASLRAWIEESVALYA